MIQRKKERTAKIALFSVSHSTYNAQFPGLYAKFDLYHEELLRQISQNGVSVFDFGLIDSSEASFAAAERINAAAPDLIVCNMITYATSSVFAPIIRSASAPVILTALQPLEGLDYGKASTFMQLENDNICSVPEFI